MYKTKLPYTSLTGYIAVDYRRSFTWISVASWRFVNLKCNFAFACQRFQRHISCSDGGWRVLSAELGSRQYLLSINCFRNEINTIFFCMRLLYFLFLPDNLPIKINCLSTLWARVRRTTGNEVYLNQVMRPQKEHGAKTHTSYCVELCFVVFFFLLFVQKMMMISSLCHKRKVISIYLDRSLYDLL